MKNVFFLAAVLAASSLAAASAAAPATSLKTTLPADAFDCTTVSVAVDGADLDPSEFTATSNGAGGCSISFAKAAPKSYVASVTDANGKVQKFSVKDGKVTKLDTPGTTSPDAVRVPG
jgi:ABC-type amino acid transport substrate-binding protein